MGHARRRFRSYVNGIRAWLVGALFATAAAGALWYSDHRAGTADPAESVPAASRPPFDDAAGTRARPQRAAPPAGDANGGESGLPSAEEPDAERDRVLQELAGEVADIALERLGDRYIDYLVANGLSRADSEEIVTTGFRAAGACTLQAMREQARVESVPLDTVLYALHAELYDTDGPLLSSTIDLKAMAARQAPCALNALQEAGIPASVAVEINRSALSR